MTFKIFSTIFLVLTVHSLEIKSDDSQTPKERKELDPLARFMQERNFRNQFIVGHNEEAINEENLLNQLIQDSQGLWQLVRRVRAIAGHNQQSQYIQEQQAELRFEQDLRTRLGQIMEQAATRQVTEEQHAQNRRMFIERLRALNSHLENVLNRYLLEQQRTQQQMMRQHITPARGGDNNTRRGMGGRNEELAGKINVAQNGRRHSQ